MNEEISCKGRIILVHIDYILYHLNITSDSLRSKRCLIKLEFATVKVQNVPSIKRIRNNELQTLVHGKDIVKFIKSQRSRWLGHVERMSEEQCLKEYCNHIVTTLQNNLRVYRMFQRLNVSQAYVILSAFASLCQISRGCTHCVKDAMNYVLVFSIRRLLSNILEPQRCINTGTQRRSVQFIVGRLQVITLCAVSYTHLQI